MAFSSEASRLPAKGAREHLREVVALEVATGERLSRIAERHGYTYAGMHGLVEHPETQLLINHYRARLDEQKVFAAKKVLLHLSDLTERELDLALPDRMEGWDSMPAEVKMKALGSPASQKARHYLMDKVWPTVQKVEGTLTHENAPETAEVLVEFRDLLRTMREQRSQRTLDILSSPHVKEGAAALPSPLAHREGANGG